LSFGFYLWHWPVLVFVLLIGNKIQADLLDGAAVIVISLSLAYLTDQLLKKPLARLPLGDVGARLRPNKVVIVSVAALLTTSSWIASNAVYGNRQEFDATSLAYEGKLELMPIEAARDRPQALKDNCNQNRKTPKLIICTYGKQDEFSKTIALVGGSHSLHWLPALEKIAKENDWRIVLATKDASPLIEDERVNPTCKVWSKALIQKLEEIRPDAVFTTSTRPDRGQLKDKRGNIDNKKPVEYVPEGYVTQWKRLEQMDVKVIAVRDTPWLGFNMPKCLGGVPSPGINCGRPRNEMLNAVDPSAKLAKLSNVAFIDLSDRFCDEFMCPRSRTT
jgi:hypothetical protein